MPNLVILERLHETPQAAKWRFARQRWYFTTRSRCAARYAHLTECSWSEAGKALDVTPGAVQLAYRRIYGTDVGRPLKATHRTSRSRCAVRFWYCTAYTWEETAELFELHVGTLWKTALTMRRAGEIRDELEDRPIEEH